MVVLLTEMGKITRDIESKQYGFGRSMHYSTGWSNLQTRIGNIVAQIPGY